MLCKQLECNSDLSIQSMILKAGYIKPIKIIKTLQGSVWRSLQRSTNKPVVIKVTDINLHENHMMFIKGEKIKIYENILIENCILKYLSLDEKCPNCIVKYIDSFKSNTFYFVVMEDGGLSLFDFIVKIHELIRIGKLEIAEWHKMAKIIFKQMMECIDYCHSKDVCHFDISLENFLINDINICVETVECGNINNDKITFCIDDKNPVQIKLCDFGLAQYFYSEQEAVDLNKFGSNKYCGKKNYKSPEIMNKKKQFDAKKNDIWCLGVCLFMMIIGIPPFESSYKSDPGFNIIINGGIVYLLTQWNRIHYVNKHLIKLFYSVFKYEQQRIDIVTLKKCLWLNE